MSFRYVASIHCESGTVIQSGAVLQVGMVLYYHYLVLKALTLIF